MSSEPMRPLATLRLSLHDEPAQHRSGLVAKRLLSPRITLGGGRNSHTSVSESSLLLRPRGLAPKPLIMQARHPVRPVLQETHMRSSDLERHLCGALQCLTNCLPPRSVNLSDTGLAHRQRRNMRVKQGHPHHDAPRRLRCPTPGQDHFAHIFPMLGPLVPSELKSMAHGIKRQFEFAAPCFRKYVLHPDCGMVLRMAVASSSCALHSHRASSHPQQSKKITTTHIRAPAPNSYTCGPATMRMREDMHA